MNKTGKYIYGVINSCSEEFFDLERITAFEDIYSSGYPTEVLNNSKTSHHAYTVCFSDIAAVVSDSEIVEYSHLPKDTLGRLLVSHQQLVEKVMAKYTIIPMRLGTFAGDDDEVREILSKGYGSIKDIFEKTKNSIEIDVVVTLNDLKSFLHEVSEEEEIRQLKQSLVNKEGGVTISDQIKVGVLVKKYLDRKKEILAGRIQAGLCETSQNIKIHDLMDDTMVLNFAFLIDKNRQEEFEQQVEQVNNEFEDKMNFRCIGPLPPYSFYTLEVKKPQFDEVNWAREKLGLKDDFITAIEIKKAHRRNALVCHPDKNPDMPDIEQKFEEMTRAYRIILDYYRASNQDQNHEGCYFNKEAFEKNAVLVTTME